MKYIILGVIQGLTEFLPVSSSGHLVIFQRIFGISNTGLVIVLVCHLGTLFSLVVFFWQDIFRTLRQPKILGYIFLVTLITGIIALSGRGFFESLFSSVKAVGLALLVTGVVLVLTKILLTGKKEARKLSLADAVILGITQSLAIIPGISRSGVTISTLLFRNIDRETAFKFSFLASLPAIAGAFVLEAKELSVCFASQSGNLILSFIFSFLSGLASLSLLRSVIRQAKLHYFGYYCLLAGTVALIFFK